MRAWVRLVVWEFGMGAIVSSALVFGTRLIASAPDNIVTVFDLSKCYAAPPNAWCGLLLVAVAAWLLWQLWGLVPPKPITDEFLKLLDDSFGRSWRRPRSWPWARLGWAYGFTFIGAVLAFSLGAIVSTVISSSTPPRTPAIRVETSERFRASQ
jgi:hypothetical protein